MGPRFRIRLALWLASFLYWVFDLILRLCYVLQVVLACAGLIAIYGCIAYAAYFWATREAEPREVAKAPLPRAKNSILVELDGNGNLFAPAQAEVVLHVDGSREFSDSVYVDPEIPEHCKESYRAAVSSGLRGTLICFNNWGRD